MKYTKIQKDKINRRLKSLNWFEKFCLFFKIAYITYKFPTGDFAGRYYINVNWLNPLTYIIVFISYFFNIINKIFINSVEFYMEVKEPISGSL